MVRYVGSILDSIFMEIVHLGNENFVSRTRPWIEVILLLHLFLFSFYFYKYYILEPFAAGKNVETIFLFAFKHFSCSFRRNQLWPRASWSRERFRNPIW